MRAPKRTRSSSWFSVVPYKIPARDSRGLDAYSRVIRKIITIAAAAVVHAYNTVRGPCRVTPLLYRRTKTSRRRFLKVVELNYRGDLNTVNYSDSSSRVPVGLLLGPETPARLLRNRSGRKTENYYVGHNNRDRWTRERPARD